MAYTGSNKVKADIDSSEIFEKLSEILNEYGISQHNKQSRILFKELKEKIQEIVFHERFLDL